MIAVLSSSSPVYREVEREEFATYECEIDRLETLAGAHVPTMLGGARSFLAGLNNWINDGDDSGLDPTVVVFPDPSSNLSMPYPADELALALAFSRGGLPERELVEELADSFSLSSGVLERPVTALSGGERMLVSLAKAWALSQRSDRFCLCSPYFWLDPKNRRLVLERFGKVRGSEGYLLLLSGEDDSPFDSTVPSEAAQKPLNWHLRLNSPSVVFPAQTFPRITSEKRISFISTAPSLELRSPTLISGPNGVGKTTLAKILTGLVTPDTGSTLLTTGGMSGNARLMLQDTVVQLFGEAPSEHLGRVFGFDRELWKEARKIYDALQKDCLKKITARLPGVSVATSGRAQTILQCKLAVLIDRLFASPPLLILDEPGWCLSRIVGRAFVESVVTAAHERGIAVAIISHQASWWDGLIADELVLELGDDSEVAVQLNNRRDGRP